MANNTLRQAIRALFPGPDADHFDNLRSPVTPRNLAQFLEMMLGLSGPVATYIEPAQWGAIATGLGLEPSYRHDVSINVDRDWIGTDYTENGWWIETGGATDREGCKLPKAICVLRALLLIQSIKDADHA